MDIVRQIRKRPVEQMFGLTVSFKYAQCGTDALKGTGRGYLSRMMSHGAETKTDS